MSDTAAPPHHAKSDISRLVNIMARLRDPDTGCPWDVKQDFASIAPYTIEEAYEVADAIERGNLTDLRDELGDLLLQVVFHSRMAEEEGVFDFNDVAASVSDKMVRRHPHVFAQADGRDADQQTAAWEEIKAAERAAKADASSDKSLLDDVAIALPALLRAEKLQKRAARAGFDWTEPDQIFEKLSEETNEVKEAIANGDQAAIADEVGDLLFVCANLARRLSVDPEQALRAANGKFSRRFKAMEALAASRGLEFERLDLDAQEALWSEVKRNEG